MQLRSEGRVLSCGYRTIWVQRKTAMVLPVVSLIASASQTWVMRRPPCAGGTQQATVPRPASAAPGRCLDLDGRSRRGETGVAVATAKSKTEPPLACLARSPEIVTRPGMSAVGGPVAEALPEMISLGAKPPSTPRRRATSRPSPAAPTP